MCLVATQITTGVTATTYEPNSFVTRRQMALFLVRTAAEADRLEIGDNIEELPAPRRQRLLRCRRRVRGRPERDQPARRRPTIAGGFPDGTYRPGAPVSPSSDGGLHRPPLRVPHRRSSSPAAAEDYFDDDDSDSAAAQASTNAVAEAGIFIGNTDGTFRPAQEITRRQMAFVLTRFLQVLFENGEIKQWSDGAPAESLITVDPAGPAVSTVSGTPGTATGEPGPAGVHDQRRFGCVQRSRRRPDQLQQPHVQRRRHDQLPGRRRPGQPRRRPRRHAGSHRVGQRSSRTPRPTATTT